MTIQELFKTLRVDYLETGHHHCRTGWIQVKECPFCSSANYHLGYHVANKFFTCWKCRWHHVIPTLIQLGASVQQAKEFYGTRVERPDPAWEKTVLKRKLVLPKFIGPLQAQHQRYLTKRGFNPTEIETLWGVKGFGIKGEFKWRLYIPILRDDVQVSWTTRSIAADAKQRYISAAADEEAIPHKHCIYGMEYCNQSIVVVEGPTDVWAIGPGAGGLFGTAFTAEQVALIARFPRRFLVFDAAKAAQKTARELAQRLAVLPGITENIVLDAKDPGSAGEKELRQLREHCGI